MAERLAIVGGDAAGMSAASAARRRDESLEVVAFERGGFTSYSACGVPYYVGGLVEELDDLVVRSPDQHRANGIDVRVGTEVVALDLARRELTLAGGGVAGFDRLLLAARARGPPPHHPRAGAVGPPGPPPGPGGPRGGGGGG